MSGMQKNSGFRCRAQTGLAFSPLSTAKFDERDRSAGSLVGASPAATGPPVTAKLPGPIDRLAIGKAADAFFGVGPGTGRPE
jgi:hypothetical protein